MALQFDDLTNTDEFFIDNNVLKGISEHFLDTYQVGQVILKALDSKPDHVSQIDAATGGQTTFAEMRDLSVRCALWLRKQGIGCGDVVTLCTHNHSDAYAPCLAIHYTGAIYNAWNHETTLQSTRHVMKLFRPKIIFACESAVEVILEAQRLEEVDAKVIVFGEHPGLQSLRDATQRQPDTEVATFHPTEIKNPKEIGLTVLSSGSSGLPKGVAHSYDSILKLLQSFMITPMKDVAVWYSTGYWITGYVNALQSILSAGTRIIHATTGPEDTCRVIDKYKVQRAFLTPIMLAHMCKSKVFETYNLKSLEVVTTAGSKMSPHLFERVKDSLPHALVIQAYGMSEIGRYIASQNGKSKNPKSVGFVGSCNQIKIVDPKTGEALGPNQPGELYLKSITMMIGYYKNPEGTKEAFDEEGWLRTGDKAYYDENGEIVIIDRLKEVMKYQNHQVSPAEVEEVLLAHPDVVEVSVVPIPHDIDGEHPMAFVKKVANSKVTEDDLVRLSSASLGEIKKLRGGVKFMEDLPKTATGKISRPHLKEMAKALAKNT
ncbi:luciferin 4-monooxygenase-like [Copidosoma floridanum]|uniref:luciferin 4-monooxygenase-like n=1 Tax=Copidosoma floridanum TaxID=29053 RepID=UPI0006C96FD6|nr:luciferin 4-monooxygenase-like [Copidosoma floridanum]